MPVVRLTHASLASKLNTVDSGRRGNLTLWAKAEGQIVFAAFALLRWLYIVLGPKRPFCSNAEVQDMHDKALKLLEVINPVMFGIVTKYDLCFTTFSETQTADCGAVLFSEVQTFDGRAVGKSLRQELQKFNKEESVAKMLYGSPAWWETGVTADHKSIISGLVKKIRAASVGLGFAVLPPNEAQW
jgi:hypothetical protein